MQRVKLAQRPRGGQSRALTALDRGPLAARRGMSRLQRCSRTRGCAFLSCAPRFWQLSWYSSRPKRGWARAHSSRRPFSSSRSHSRFRRRRASTGVPRAREQRRRRRLAPSMRRMPRYRLASARSDASCACFVALSASAPGFVDRCALLALHERPIARRNTCPAAVFAAICHGDPVVRGGIGREISSGRYCAQFWWAGPPLVPQFHLRHPLRLRPSRRRQTKSPQKKNHNETYSASPSLDSRSSSHGPFLAQRTPVKESRPKGAA